MCGDGSNDCSALKAAHVGISLSEADASVASPFTSREPNISCVPNIIKEGRAALVTSFGVFKFMLCYSLLEFSSAIILYSLDNNLTSLEYLFIDVCLVLFIASFLGKTKASTSLHATPPMTSLLTFVPLTSIVLFMICNVSAQVFSFFNIQTYSWFTPYVYKNTNEFASYENYAVFCTSMFQYISMAVVFSKGEPYRKPIYTNKILIFCLVLLTALCSYITVSPADFIVNELELKLPPYINPRLTILIIAFVNFLICLLVDDFVVDYVIKYKIKPKFKRSLTKSNKIYLKILDEIDGSNWPLEKGIDKCDKIKTVMFKDECEFEESKYGIDNLAFEIPKTKSELNEH